VAFDLAGIGEKDEKRSPRNASGSERRLGESSGGAFVKREESPSTRSHPIGWLLIWQRQGRRTRNELQETRAEVSGDWEKAPGELSSSERRVLLLEATQTGGFLFGRDRGEGREAFF